jgi:hypothetical protein
MPGSVQSERTRFTAALHDAATIDYVYDFGDNWHHRIKLGKTLPSEAQLRLPLCVAGANATPPDDCGGVYGHYEFVAAVTDPNRPEHAEMAEWIGRPWAPSEFDIGRVNAYLSNIKV